MKEKVGSVWVAPSLTGFHVRTCFKSPNVKPEEFCFSTLKEVIEHIEKALS